MGKITMQGKAVREVNYDAEKYHIHVFADAKKEKEAISKVQQKCEELLQKLQSANLNPQDIQLGSEEISRRTRYINNKDEEYYEVNRNLIFEAPFDMKMHSLIWDITAQFEDGIEISSEYQLTNKDALHKELMNEALKDSKQRAQMVADMMDQHITGIEEIIVNRFDSPVMYKCNREMMDMECASFGLTEQLSSAKTREEEEVTVIWIIE